jgi:nitrate reductase NapD
MSADMQMAYSEDELSAHMEVLNNADVVPKVLNDKNVQSHEIIYNGDLKKKDLEGFAKTFDKTGK